MYGSEILVKIKCDNKINQQSLHLGHPKEIFKFLAFSSVLPTGIVKDCLGILARESEKETGLLATAS